MTKVWDLLPNDVGLAVGLDSFKKGFVKCLKGECVWCYQEISHGSQIHRLSFDKKVLPSDSPSEK